MATTYTEYAKFNYVHGVSSSANVEPRIFASGSSESTPKLYISQSTGIIDLAGANSLTYAGDSGTGTVNLGTQTFTVAGTANEVETSAASQTLTVGLPTNVTVAGNLTLGGNLVGDADENKEIFAATTTATNTITLGGGGQVVCAGDLDVADDVTLSSDSAVLSLGAGADATLTHDGTTGLTIAATPISVDSTGQLDLNSTTGDINFQDGGTNQLALDMDGTAGEVIMQLKVDADDFVFKQYDGTEVFRVEDNGAFDIAGGLGSSGVTVSAAGAISADGRIVTDDTTEATSTTDGSLQTDGGLSVAKSAVIGDDLDLLSDSAIINVGSTSKFTLTDQAANNCLMATANHRLAFGNAGDYVTGDGTDITVVGSADVIADAGDKVILDADGGSILCKDGGTLQLKFQMDHGSGQVIAPQVSGDDLLFSLEDTGEIARFDSSADSFLMTTTSKIEFGDGNKFIHSDGTDLQLSSSSDVAINANDYIYLDARGGANVLQADGNTYGYLGKTSAGTLMLSASNASQHLMFKAGLNGNIITSASANIILESNAGKVLYHDDGTMYGSIQQSGGDMLFYDAGETEIFRLDASADSLLMASTKKIEFNDATQYIGASSAADLDIAATTDVNIDCTTLDVNAAANISGQTVFQTGIVPDANDGAYLGQSGTGFSDLFLADGAVINVNAGNSTLTGGSALWQSNVAFQATRLRIDSAADYIDVSTDMQLVAAADILLDPAGGDVKVDGNMLPNAADGGTLGSAALEWSDLFLADSSAIKFGNDQDTTLTHTDGTGLTLNSTNKLCFQDTATFVNSSADGQLDIDADVEVEISTATLDVDATTAVAITSPSVVIDSGTSDKPVLEIKNTNADANPATLKFNKDSASPADSDELGEIDFYGDDSGGNSDLMAKILVVQTDVTATEEDAKMAFKVRVAGSLKTMEWGNAAGLVLPNDSTNGIVTAHSYVTYSDETLKTNINPLDNALDTVKSLRGVSYDWKDDGKSDIGFIAQEVNQVIPEVVRANSGADDHYGLDYARLTAVLVEAVKELAAKVENNNK